MRFANTPAMISLAPWIHHGCVHGSVIWINPMRENRVQTSAPHSILDAEPGDMNAASPLIAIAVARLRKGLTTGLRFGSLRDGAHGFVLLTAAAPEIAA
jgi:hypothetical protein